MASAAQTALENLSRVERPVRLAVELFLVICLALLTARLVWTIAIPTEAVADYTDRPLPSPMRGTSSTLGFSTDRTLLLTTNPFSQGEVEEVIVDAPETSLNLNLIGLRMSTDQDEQGTAIIRTPNGMAKNFGVGDELLGGVTLERILSDRVIINRDGATETLMLGGRAAGLSVITDDSQTIQPDASPAVGSSETVSVEPDTSIITGQLAGADEFFGAVEAAPLTVDGRLTGYRLTPIGSASTMTRAGLQPGDILESVNGVSVSDLDIVDMVDRISSIETAELQINRDGSVRTVRLRFGG